MEEAFNSLTIQPQPLYHSGHENEGHSRTPAAWNARPAQYPNTIQANLIPPTPTPAPRISYISAIHSLRESVMVSSDPPRESAPFELQILAPSTQTLRKDIRPQFAIKQHTTLSTLVMRLQAEIDNVTTYPTLLLSTIEICVPELSDMPILKGELLGVSEDGRSAHCVRWECRTGMQAGRYMMDYWDNLRDWILRQWGLNQGKLLVKVTTKLQDANSMEGMRLGMSKGHHFVKSLDELVDNQNDAQASHPRAESLSRRDTSRRGLRKTGRVTPTTTMTVRQETIPQRADPNPERDHAFVTAIRESTRNMSLTFRPSTPELVLASKILHYGDVTEKARKPGYEEMMGMHEDILLAGYPPLPSLIINDNPTGQEENVTLTWGVYQKMGRTDEQMCVRDLIDLRSLSCGKKTRYMYVHANDPLYNTPYKFGSDSEWENLAATMIGGNVEMVAEQAETEIKMTIEMAKQSTGNRQTHPAPFSGSKAFDSDDDQVFCGGELNTVPKAAQQVNEPVPLLSQQEQDERRRRQVAYDIAKFNVDRFRQQTAIVSGYQAALSQYNSSPLVTTTNQQQHQYQIAQGPAYHSPIPLRATAFQSINPSFEQGGNRSRSGSGNVVDHVAFGNLSTGTPLSSNHSRHNSTNSTPALDLNIGRTTNFNPATPAFQFGGDSPAGKQNIPLPQFNPFRMNSSNATINNWHNFAFNQAQPQNNIAASTAAAPTTNRFVSPFAHRFPVRYNSSSQNTTADGVKAAPVPVVQLTNASKKTRSRNPSPLRRHVNPPDQTYGTSLRLINTPTLKHNAASVMKAQEKAAADAHTGLPRGTANEKLKTSH